VFHLTRARGGAGLAPPQLLLHSVEPKKPKKPARKLSIVPR
jgi:hypothetical protein